MPLMGTVLTNCKDTSNIVPILITTSAHKNLMLFAFILTDYNFIFIQNFFIKIKTVNLQYTEKLLRVIFADCSHKVIIQKSWKADDC